MKIKVNDSLFDAEIIVSDFGTISVFKDSSFEIGQLTFVEDANNSNVIWLNRIETKKEFQHMGVGTALMQLFETYSVKNGFMYVEGKYYPLNEYAKPFYDKMGYSVYRDDYDLYIGKLLDKKIVAEKYEPNIFDYEVLSQKEDKLNNLSKNFDFEDEQLEMN